MLGHLCDTLSMYFSYMQATLFSCLSFLSSSSSIPVTQEVTDTGQEDNINTNNIRDKIVEDLGMDKKPDTEHVRCSF